MVHDVKFRYTYDEVFIAFIFYSNKNLRYCAFVMFCIVRACALKI